MAEATITVPTQDGLGSEPHGSEAAGRLTPVRPQHYPRGRRRRNTTRKTRAKKSYPQKTSTLNNQEQYVEL